MKLTVQSQVLDYVGVIRCEGRIASGEELQALQLVFEEVRYSRTSIVLQLAEVDYIDSSGLGALIRFFMLLRSAGGGLKLCRLSPFVLRVFQVTNLLAVFPTYESERAAIEAFSTATKSSQKAPQTTRATIVCIDNSADVLAYLNTLLTRAGYEVFTSLQLRDAKTLVGAARPHVVICGPGTQTNGPVMENILRSVPDVQILALPSDFSTAEASQAGTELVDRLQEILTPKPSAG